MLLVGQLYRRNTKDAYHRKTGVVDSNPGLKAYGRRKKLIELISSDSSIQTAELALILAVAEQIVDRDLSWLEEHDYISREGSSENGYWKILKNIGD